MAKVPAAAADNIEKARMGLRMILMAKLGMIVVWGEREDYGMDEWFNVMTRG